MEERISTPHNIMAFLEQTNHFTKLGLSVLNLSIIYPSYCGYVTCVAANLSSRAIQIAAKDTVARLTFFEVEPDQTSPIPPKNEILETDYDRALLDEAVGREDTFIGVADLREEMIGSLHDTATKTFTNATRTVTLIGGMLLFAFTLMPVFQSIVTDKFLMDRSELLTEIRQEIQSSRGHHLTEAQLSLLVSEIVAEKMTALKKEMAK